MLYLLVTTLLPEEKKHRIKEVVEFLRKNKKISKLKEIEDFFEEEENFFEFAENFSKNENQEKE